MVGRYENLKTFEELRKDICKIPFLQKALPGIVQFD